MQAGVKERVQSKHPTELAQPAPPGDSTRGSDEECEDQEYQREEPGRPDGEVDRVGAELAPPGVPAEDDGRHGAVKENGEFGEWSDLHSCRRPQKFARRSIPE